MSADAVLRSVRAAASALPPGTAIAPETALSDLGYDSMQLLHLVVALEETLGICIGDAEITADNFGTVGAIVAFIHRRT